MTQPQPMARNASVAPETEAQVQPSATPQASPPLARIPYSDCRSAMHPGVYKLALLCWVGLMAVFWVTFSVSTSATFMVTVGTFYALVFFGVPFIMTRMAPKGTNVFPSFGEFLQGRFDTIYGPVGATEALFQVIMVPLALGIGGVAIGLIIHFARMGQ